MEGVALLVLDLPLEVFLLVRGADSGVDEFFLLTGLVVVVTEELEDVVLEVEALASGQALASDFSTIRPSPEAGV